MDKAFVMYVPGSKLSEFHKRSPWVMIPKSFKEMGYLSILICGSYNLSSSYGIDVYTTVERKKSLLNSLFEPFLAFRRIFAVKPDIVLISPIGSYLFSIIPLIIIYSVYEKITGSKKTKFILKTDWSLDFTNIKWYKRTLLVLLLVLSSYSFDRVSIETYCGVTRAKMISIIRVKAIIRVPLGYPQNIDFDSHITNSKKENIILCVARITEMKGQIILLKSFSNLFQKYPNWKLRFIGPIEDANYKSQLDTIIQENNLKDRVSFESFVIESILLEELRQASIFCLPSIHTESAGQVKYEAIALGVPVVTTDIPCRRDNEELGFLVSSAGSVEELTNNLELLIVNPQLRRAMADFSKKNLFSYKRTAELIRDL